MCVLLCGHKYLILALYLELTYTRHYAIILLNFVFVYDADQSQIITIIGNYR